jgi:hypothetical protein
VAIDRLLGQLREDFAVKDLGPLNYFLGVRVHHHIDGFTLTQHKCIHDLLSRTNMLAASAAVTPMVPVEKITITDGEPLLRENSTRYRSVAGALQYIADSTRYFVLGKSCLSIYGYPYFSALDCS